jgi:hypothetical protein
MNITAQATTLGPPTTRLERNTMNAHTHINRFSRSRFSVITWLLVALGMALTFTPTTSAQEATPEVLATQFFDAVGGNATLMLFSDNAVLHSPEGEFGGRSGVALFGLEMGASFTDLTFATQSVEAVDNLLIIRFALTGINTGGYHDVEANCAGFAVPGVAVLQFGETSFVTDHWSAGAMSQHLDGLEVTVSEVGVVEQWIGYDSHSVVNQLLAFNQFDPNVTRTTCADVSAAQDAPTYQAPPACLTATLCESPF